LTGEGPALQAALKRFEGRHPKTIDLSLGRILAALDRLGRPQDRLPPVIHVAGTNGKGSTCAFLRAMAEAAGLSTHVFTSPHLVRFNERVRLAGALVDDATYVAALERVLDAVGDGTITFFEATTAAALLLFAEVPADLLILEVGLGGRFDATNVIDRPAVSVITPVDFDHKEYLGTEITRIGWEKAGIIKPGVPVASAVQRPEVAGVIALEAWQRGAPLHVLGRPLRVDIEDGRMRYRGPALDSGWARPGLTGAHQFANAGLAALALELWRDARVTGPALGAGIAAASWPARMQALGEGPLTRRFPGQELWLDGGHNPHAARALAEVFEPPVTLVTAMMANKDHAGFFAAFGGVAAEVITIPNAEGHKGAAPEDLAQAARSAGLDARPAPDLDAALAGCPAGRVLICGSLYLAGKVLALNEEFPV
jgi:dihydrofolate synthase / folylpolyglutamate synthase